MNWETSKILYSQVFQLIATQLRVFHKNNTILNLKFKMYK